MKGNAFDSERLQLLEAPKVIFVPEPDLGLMPEGHVWVTAMRQRIPVKQMTTGHINRCIDCWNGVGNKRIPADYLGGKDKWLAIFADELASRN